MRTVYDPCCGSGGMLTIARDHISGNQRRRARCLPLWARGQPRDIRDLQVRSVYEERRWARRRKYYVWQHALTGSARARTLRLSAHQSSLWQRLEEDQDSGRGRGRGGAAVASEPVAAYQRWTVALSATHALPYARPKKAAAASPSS